MQPGPQNPQAPQAAPQAQSGGPGEASKLVAGIYSDMSKVMDMMDMSKGIAPQEKQQFASLMAQYQDFVENVLGSGPGAQKQAPQAPPARGGVVTPEAGASEVNPAL